jgi:hypothetical protein
VYIAVTFRAILLLRTSVFLRVLPGIALFHPDFAVAVTKAKVAKFLSASFYVSASPEERT